MSATTAIKVNPFHDVIDLSSTEGKKMHQKETEGLPNHQKHDGGTNDIINFVERVESKGEDFG